MAACQYCGGEGCNCPGNPMCDKCREKYEAINRNIYLTEEQKFIEFQKLHVNKQQTQ